MDFMYKKRDEILDREEYLKGKRIDKTFEEFSKGEPENGENCVEHEVLPASISRRTQMKGDNNDQVDLFRKQMEDPLMIIAKKTFEAAQKKFSTPESLTKIHRMLKKERMKKSSRVSLK
jgi:hypothetical protein